MMLFAIKGNIKDFSLSLVALSVLIQITFFLTIGSFIHLMLHLKLTPLYSPELT